MIIEDLKGKVIVSSQAMPGEPFYDENCMMAMMQSAINGGAGGLRVAGKRDVINATTFGVPVIGLTKPDKLPENWRSIVYITPGIKEVKEPFKVLAYTEDGVIEAIQSTEYKIIGTMWHPEREQLFSQKDIERVRKLFG